jgi:hypothetical protein
MEWLIGTYLTWGVLKGFNRLFNPDPSTKPAWMSLEKNPLKIALSFTLYVLLWPIAS